jgi:hypothetical protein
MDKNGDREGITLRSNKFMRGIITGIIAGLIKDIPSIIVHLLHSDVFPTYWDYTGMIGLGIVPNTALNIIFATVVELGFSMAVGISIVYIISKTKSHHYLIEGSFLGAAVWFSLRSIIWIFNVKDFAHPQMFAFIINFTTSIVYGLLIAYLDKLLQKAKN